MGAADDLGEDRTFQEEGMMYNVSEYEGADHSDYFCIERKRSIHAA